MDVRELVREHYTAGDLTAAILGTLAAAGTDVDHLQAADLFPVDQLHAGGARATRSVLDLLELETGTRLLDVGCGIGGTARMAALAGAQVTGVDLTPEFVTTATELTARTGLSERATFTVTPGETLPFDDRSFGAAVMIHVGMNIPDKRAVFAEVHRVLAAGGRFVLYEQMRTGAGPLPYPLPWAEDERSSFVEPVEDYRSHLEAVGFTVQDVEDRTAGTSGPPPGGPVSPVVVFGPAFAERVAHNVAASRAGILGSIVISARAG